MLELDHLGYSLAGITGTQSQPGQVYGVVAVLLGRRSNYSSAPVPFLRHGQTCSQDLHLTMSSLYRRQCHMLLV